MMLSLWFLILYFVSCATCAYIPIQDDYMLYKEVNRKNNISNCIPVRFELDDESNIFAKKSMVKSYSISEEIDRNCHLCKRNPMNPWQKVKHRYRNATPARQQHVAMATGVGLVTLGAVATPVPESPMKREVQDVNALLIKVDEEKESTHNSEKDNNNNAAILCTFDHFDGQITKRSQFLQTAGMTVMFGGMVIGPGVASIKSHMSKKDKSQASSATIAKRSPSFLQPESNNIKLRKRGAGLEFLNTASLAGMVGGTVIAPGVAAIKAHQQNKNQRLQKRSPDPGMFKSIFKAIPTAISTGKDIHGIIKHRKRDLQEDELAPIFEKRARFKGLGKMIGHLNTAGTVAMVGSTGLAAHGSIKEGWNQKKNAAAAAAAPPPKKRDLEIDISPNRNEILIRKRQPTRGLNGGRARSSRGSKGQARNAARAERAAQASPKTTKMEKTMTGLGAAMSAGMIVSFAGEAKNAISGQPARKREEVGEGMAFVKRGRGLSRLFGKSKPMPAQKPTSKPAAKPSPKPAGKAAPKNGKSGGGIGGKVAGAAGAAMSAASVVSFAGEAKAAVQKPPPQAGAAPAARKRALEYSLTMVKRSPKPTKIGGSPRSRTKPNKPAPARSQSSAGSGGSKMGGALETAGTVSMVAGMATPVLTPAASAAHNAWDKVRAKFGGKKKQA